MSPDLRVMGVPIHVDSDKPPTEDTPHEFRLKELKEEVRRRRDHDRAIEARVTVVEKAVETISQEQKAGNRRTLLAVAAIGFVGALVAALIGYWGQVRAVAAGASQAKIGAAQVIQSTTPSTEDTRRAGEEHGRQLEYERWQQWQSEHPLPIAKQETIAARGKGR